MERKGASGILYLNDVELKAKLDTILSLYQSWGVSGLTFGSGWFVGNAAGLMDWITCIRFTFLIKGKTYKATIYEDDGKGSIEKRKSKVNKDDELPVALKGKTGQAMIIGPGN